MEDVQKIQIKIIKMKTTMFKMKDTLEGLNSRVDIAGEKTTKLEDTQQKLSKMKHREQREIFKMKSISELWENFKQSNIYVIGVPEKQMGSVGGGVRIIFK